MSSHSNTLTLFWEIQSGRLGEPLIPQSYLYFGSTGIKWNRPANDPFMAGALVKSMVDKFRSWNYPGNETSSRTDVIRFSFCLIKARRRRSEEVRHIQDQTLQEEHQVLTPLPSCTSGQGGQIQLGQHILRLYCLFM